MQIYEITEDVHQAEQARCEEIRMEVRHLLDNAKRHLTERQLQCIEMQYIDGMSQADIARHFNVSREAIRVCVDKGLDRIRDIVHDT